MIRELPYKSEVTSGACKTVQFNKRLRTLSKNLLEVNPEIFSSLSTEKVRSSLCTVYNENPVEVCILVLTVSGVECIASVLCAYQWYALSATPGEHW